jgi:ribosome-associated protein
MTDGETIPRPESEKATRDRLKAGGAPEELEHVLDAALERNARKVLILDLRGLSDVADYFVIASGDSDTHARAVADNILDRVRAAGLRPVGVEGQHAGRWILLDFVTVIVHIFLPRVRDFYQLERLWGDAPRFELT